MSPHVFILYRKGTCGARSFSEIYRHFHEWKGIVNVRRGSWHLQPLDYRWHRNCCLIWGFSCERNFKNSKTGNFVCSTLFQMFYNPTTNCDWEQRVVNQEIPNVLFLFTPSHQRGYHDMRSREHSEQTVLFTGCKFCADTHGNSR